jgi:heat shock protein HtpX
MSNLVTFRDLIAANRRASFLLVAGFVLFVAVVAVCFGVAFLYWSTGSATWDQLRGGFIAGLVAAVIAFFVAWLSYFTGDSMVLGVSGARPLGEAEDPALRNVVEEMAIAAGVPVPRIYLIDDTAMNAFATGRDPQHASVAITTGLRAKLTRDELQGVIAHEMSHVRNYDIRLMLLLAVLVGTIVMLSDFFWRALRTGAHWGSSGTSRRRDSKDGAGAIVAIMVVLAFVLSILAPILAQIIQWAVSRQREYLADASAVELTRTRRRPGAARGG